jgi:hypothetical protein
MKMNAKSKYQFDISERGKVYWNFYRWLERTAGKEAAETLTTLTEASVFAEVFDEYPESLLTLNQKRMITSAKKGLVKSAAWLKDQGVL